MSFFEIKKMILLSSKYVSRLQHVALFWDFMLSAVSFTFVYSKWTHYYLINCKAAITAAVPLHGWRFPLRWCEDVPSIITTSPRKGDIRCNGVTWFVLQTRQTSWVTWNKMQIKSGCSVVWDWCLIIYKSPITNPPPPRVMVNLSLHGCVPHHQQMETEIHGTEPLR